jgi:ankyrin repeat protein
VLLLLEQGADINDGELLPIIMKRKFWVQYCFTPLQAASLAGHEHLARLLVKSERSCRILGKTTPL